jgi:hypothetical protein
MAACGLVAQPAFLFTEKSSGGQSDSDVKKSVGEADVLRAARKGEYSCDVITQSPLFIHPVRSNNV